MKYWIHKGIYQIKEIIDDQNNLIPFQELENLVGRAPHRLLEYNAVKATLQQARQHNRLHPSNNRSKEDSHNMTLNGTPVTSLSVKGFRQLLTEYTKPCSVNFWKKRFDTEIDNRYWEVAFNANQETRLKVLQWKILHNIYPTNILLHKMEIANSGTCNACHSGEILLHLRENKPYLATSEKGNTSTHRQ